MDPYLPLYRDHQVHFTWTHVPFYTALYVKVFAQIERVHHSIHISPSPKEPSCVNIKPNGIRQFVKKIFEEFFGHFLKESLSE